MAIDKTAATATGNALDVLIKDTTISDSDVIDTIQFIVKEVNDMGRALRDFSLQKTREQIQTDLETHVAKVKSGSRGDEEGISNE